MAVYTTNGAKIFIGETLTPGTVSESDFSSVAWVQIKDVMSIGTIGDAANEVTYATLEDGRQQRRKGVRDAGTMDLTCGLNASDPGQIALKAAETEQDDFAFKIELPDGATRMFVAMVGSAQETVNEADNIITLKATLWVNSNTVRVAAP